MKAVEKINAMERTFTPQVPEPMVGHLVVRKIPIESLGRIIVPGEDAQGEQKLERLRVVATAKQFMNGITLMDVPFGPGDYVIVRPGGMLAGHPNELPKDYRLVHVSDVMAYHKCPTGEQPKGEA